MPHTHSFPPPGTTASRNTANPAQPDNERKTSQRATSLKTIKLELTVRSNINGREKFSTDSGFVKASNRLSHRITRANRPGNPAPEADRVQLPKSEALRFAVIWAEQREVQNPEVDMEFKGRSPEQSLDRYR